MGPHCHEMEWNQPLSLGAPGRVEVTGGKERPGANQYHGFLAEPGQHSVWAAYFGLVPWFCFLKRKQNQHRQANGSHAILWFKPQRKECGAWGVGARMPRWPKGYWSCFDSKGHFSFWKVAAEVASFLRHCKGKAFSCWQLSGWGKHGPARDNQE